MDTYYKMCPECSQVAGYILDISKAKSSQIVNMWVDEGFNVVQKVDKIILCKCKPKKEENNEL